MSRRRSDRLRCSSNRDPFSTRHFLTTDQAMDWHSPTDASLKLGAPAVSDTLFASVVPVTSTSVARGPRLPPPPPRLLENTWKSSLHGVGGEMDTSVQWVTCVQRPGTLCCLCGARAPLAWVEGIHPGTPTWRSAQAPAAVRHVLSIAVCAIHQSYTSQIEHCNMDAASALYLMAQRQVQPAVESGQ